MGKNSSSSRFHVKREVIGVVLIAFSFLLVLSLFSFNPDDPSFNHQFSEPQKATNLAGFVGAYLADLFFQAFGFIAFIWPVTLGFFALKLFLSTETNFSRPAKMASWILLLITTCGFLSLVIGKVNVFGTTMDSGGALGRILARTADLYLNLMGAGILFVAGNSSPPPGNG
ncbi:MAG: DNA translocase FtsK 4TM domain-containing protein [Deltaproteobacteria bacterium]|nr:DNA translocase FtsK 4TM domain-containing protein [Deltaproteobacteria bacterium]